MRLCARPARDSSEFTHSLERELLRRIRAEMTSVPRTQELRRLGREVSRAAQRNIGTRRELCRTRIQRLIRRNVGPRPRVHALQQCEYRCKTLCCGERARIRVRHMIKSTAYPRRQSTACETLERFGFREARRKDAPAMPGASLDSRVRYCALSAFSSSRAPARMPGNA
jgi:hypothetical protein